MSIHKNGRKLSPSLTWQYRDWCYWESHLHNLYLVITLQQTLCGSDDITARTGPSCHTNTGHLSHSGNPRAGGGTSTQPVRLTRHPQLQSTRNVHVVPNTSLAKHTLGLSGHKNHLEPKISRNIGQKSGQAFLDFLLIDRPYTLIIIYSLRICY